MLIDHLGTMGCDILPILTGGDWDCALLLDVARGPLPASKSVRAWPRHQRTDVAAPRGQIMYSPGLCSKRGRCRVEADGMHRHEKSLEAIETGGEPFATCL